MNNKGSTLRLLNSYSNPWLKPKVQLIKTKDQAQDWEEDEEDEEDEDLLLFQEEFSEED